jgi:hypothetical protein
MSGELPSQKWIEVIAHMFGSTKEKQDDNRRMVGKLAEHCCCSPK